MNNDSISNTVFSLVHSYKQAMRSSLKAHEVGLNAMHVQCLPYIHASNVCTANDLVTFFSRDKAQIARLIKEMIAHNWISKSANPDDKRSQLLVLTAEGRELVALITDTQDKVHRKMSENLNEQQLHAFTQVAEVMSSNLKNIRE